MVALTDTCALLDGRMPRHSAETVLGRHGERLERRCAVITILGRRAKHPVANAEASDGGTSADDDAREVAARYGGKRGEAKTEIRRLPVTIAHESAPCAGKSSRATHIGFNPIASTRMSTSSGLSSVGSGWSCTSSYL